MVEENPEYFLSDVDNFFAPDTIGAGVIDGSDEARRLSFFRRGGVVEVGEERAGSGDEEVRRGGGEVGEKEANDYAAGGELAGAFFLFVEEHGEKGGEEGRLDGGEVVEGERGGAESLEAEQCLVEEGVLMFLSRCKGQSSRYSNMMFKGRTTSTQPPSSDATTLLSPPYHPW